MNHTAICTRALACWLDARQSFPPVVRPPCSPCRRWIRLVFGQRGRISLNAGGCVRMLQIVRQSKLAVKYEVTEFASVRRTGGFE
eukprot:336720-Rhodomonas_salina.1